jgi:hypothetical protein
MAISAPPPPTPPKKNNILWKSQNHICQVEKKMRRLQEKQANFCQISNIWNHKTSRLGALSSFLPISLLNGFRV